MTIQLHRALWLHEQKTMEVERRDLHGDPLLCTSLDTFNRFVCLYREQQVGAFAKAHMDCANLNPELIRAYFKSLYEDQHFKSRDVTPCAKDLRAFIESTWAETQNADPMIVEDNLNALDLNFKELKRLRLVYRYLLELCLRLQPKTPPTECYDQNPDQLRLFSPEIPVVENSLHDLWVVVNKSDGGAHIIVRGQVNEELVRLDLPRGLGRHLQKEDRIPMTIATAWDGQYFIHETDAPLF